MASVIELKNISKTFVMGEISVQALKHLSITIDHGDFVAVMGSSGSGKSTMMNILGCLSPPTSGEYLLENQNVAAMKPAQLANIRNTRIGFVFQGYNLLPRTSAVENVELPLVYDRKNRIPNPRLKAREMLELVGLKDRMTHEPNRLSGGQQQRVAIARALVNDPAIILADEPTGNLDSKTSIDIMKTFQELNRRGITIVLVTHEEDIAGYTRRIIELRDGIVVKDSPVEGMTLDRTESAVQAE